MWTPKNRPCYERKDLRYESGLTDQEYRLIEPFLPSERGVFRRCLSADSLESVRALCI
jgi:hypothetical protein